MGTLYLSLLLVGLIFGPTCQGSIINRLFSSPAVNCSQLCKCDTRNLEDVLGEYANKHSLLMGKEYRSDEQDALSNPYIGLFGSFFYSFIKTIVTITCDVSDKRNHGISELLNGADLHFYTYLDVECRYKEKLLWDLPPKSEVNILGVKHCNIERGPNNEDLMMPLNLWMVEIYGGDQSIFEQLNVQHTMTVVSFILHESSLKSIPKRWSESYFLSSNIISFKNNKLTDYQCDIPMYKSLDTLNLARNNLVRFPKCIIEPNAVDITYLSLAGNAIYDISALLSTGENANMPNIKIIDLRKNDIAKLDEFKTLPNLKILDLGHNKIRTIRKDTFRNILNLELLSLAKNKIDLIEDHAFQNLEHLKVLDLTGNKLVHLHYTIFPIVASHLTISLQDNKFGHPPFGDCERNKTSYIFKSENYNFFLAGNPLICDCSAASVNKCLRWLKTQGLYDAFYKDIEQLECQIPAATKGKNYVDVLKDSTCIYTDRCPSECTCTFENEEMMIVNCSSAGLKNIPDNIPTITSFSLVPNVKLYLNNNKLQEIGYRPYFEHLVELYLHNSRISKVTTGAMDALQNVKILTLHENRLERLPSRIINMSFNHLENLTLHGNKWACTSDQRWLPKWMNQYQPAIFMPEKILCNSFYIQPLLTFEDDTSRFYSIISAVIAALMTSVIFAFILRRKITEQLYVTFGVRLMDLFIYGDVYSPYDAFVFYSQHDYKWIVETLVRRLEEGQVRYKLCLHFRDFPQNEVAMDNIPWAVRLSRCSILLLTNKFLNTEWSLRELRAIVVEHLLVNNRLLVVAASDVRWEDLPGELQDYMAAHPSLCLGEANFWSKLKLYLPPARPVTADKQGEVTNARGGAGDRLLEPSKSLVDGRAAGRADGHPAARGTAGEYLTARDCLHAAAAAQRADLPALDSTI